MRHWLLATASTAAIALYATGAAALSQSVPPGTDLSLRGALDQGALDQTGGTNGSTAKSRKHKLFESSEPAAPPQAVMESWGTTAQSIEINYYKYTGTAKGKGVVIGIVDSGIDLDHPQFTGRVLPGKCFGGYSKICTVAGATLGGDPGIFPYQTTHGTHVAGIAAGSATGLASQAQILPVKVCDTYTNSCPGDIDGAIVWAAQHGAKVINLSLGGGSLYLSDINAAKTAIANGAVIVVAAGNSGNGIPTGGFMSGAALQPGVVGALIVVGATDTNNVIAPYSQTPGNTCQTFSGVTNCMRNYFVVAPGSGILSSVGGGGYGYLSGTSMATPFVTGLAALIKGQWSFLTPYQVANIIFATATDLGAVGVDNVYGRGAVNVAAALSPVGGTTITTVTGGTTVTTATGKPGALNTKVSGILSMPMASSALLKNVVIVDAFGRNFTADLSVGVQNPTMSLAGIVGEPFRNVAPFAITTDAGAFGTVSMSGFAERSTTPDMSGPRQGLVRETTMHNLAFSFSPADNVSLDFGHNLSLSGYFNGYDTRANQAANSVFLSASALNSPYLAIADGGTYMGASITPAKGLKVRFGYAAVDTGDQAYQFTPFQSGGVNGPAQFSPHQARSAVMGASWEVSRWAGIGVTASQTVEQGSVLGGITSGALAISNQTDTTSVGFSARFDLGDGWQTNFAWNEGVTKLNVAPGGIMTSASALRSRSYGVGFVKTGLNLIGSDTFGFALTRPLHVYSGSADLKAATGVDDQYNLIFGSEHLSLAAERPETDVELGYATSLLGGKLNLQANAAYQMDANGAQGKNAVAMLTRAAFKF